MDKHANPPPTTDPHGTSPAQKESQPASASAEQATLAGMPLLLRQELEHLTRLLHTVNAPIGSQEPEMLHALAKHMQSIVEAHTCALRSEAFVCHLETEIHRVRRGRSELSLICFNLQKQDDIIRKHGQQAITLACQALVQSVKGYALPCDCIGHIPSGHYAVILPGVSSFKAQIYIEKVLHECAGQTLRTAHGTFTPHFVAGIACASGTNAQVNTLLQEALTALHSAAGTTNFCAVYRDTSTTGLYQTLVQSKEKRFLFSGGQ